MSLVLGFLILILVLIFLVIFFSFVPLGLWISALAAGVRIKVTDLIGMRLRRVPLE